MRSQYRYWGTVLSVALAAMAMSQAAMAQQKEDKQPSQQQDASQGQSKSLSERSVRVIQGFAWQIMPKEYTTPTGTVIKVEGEDPRKFIIPIDDARRIIVAARRSANAELCNLREHQAANYTVMMNVERDSKKWSKEQLLYIHQLHLFTVMWLTGNVNFDGEKVKTKEEASKAIDEGIAKTEKAESCSDEERLKVRDNIEAYIEAHEKS